jgi:hypothetical protein
LSNRALRPLEGRQPNFRRVGHDLFVKMAGLLIRAAPVATTTHDEQHIAPLERKFDPVTDANGAAGLLARLAIDADGTRGNEGLGETTRFRHACEEEPFIDALLRDPVRLSLHQRLTSSSAP